MPSYVPPTSNRHKSCVLFAKDDLGRPAADAMGSQFYSAVSNEIARAWSPASQMLRSLR